MPLKTDTPALAARRYVERGWQPVPIPAGLKGPRGDAWQNRRFTSEDIPNLGAEFLPGANVGLIVGPASGGLVDVDLDCEEAVSLARVFLPKTGLVHGRASKPLSHYWYRVDPKVCRARSAYTDPVTRKMLVELRSSDGVKGFQTMVPPSVHPDGEDVVWYEYGEPLETTHEALEAAVRVVAAASLLARHFPAQGARHEFALALSGLLLKYGVPEDDAYAFVYEVCRAGGSTDPGARAQTVRSTARKIAEDGQATGFPTLAKVVGGDDEKRGEAVVKRACEWLDLRDDSLGKIAEFFDRERAGVVQSLSGAPTSAPTRAPTSAPTRATPAPPTVVEPIVLPEVSKPQTDDFDPDYSAKLKRGQNGRLLSCGFNAYTILRNCSATRGCFRFDDVAKEIVVSGEYAGVDPEVLPVRVANDLMQVFDLDVSEAVVARQVLSIAFENRFDPIRDYLRSVAWDGVPRISEGGGWLAKYARAVPPKEDGSAGYVEFVGRKWLLSMVARALDPGCKADLVLVLEGVQGARKCLGRGTSVMMFDGSVKKVEDVVDGDVLMGPDSKPRIVSGTVQGVGPLKRIVPIKGDAWVCNDAHILTVATRDEDKRWIDVSVSDCYTDKSGQTNVRGDGVGMSKSARIRGATQTAKIRGGDVVKVKDLYRSGLSMREIANKIGNVSQTAIRNAILRENTYDEFIGNKVRNRKSERVAQVRVGVEFPDKDVSVDPYIVGMWLGDGTSTCPAITNEDEEVIEFCKRVAPEYGTEAKIKPAGKCKKAVNIYFSTGKKKGLKKTGRNRLRNLFKTLIIEGQKRISREYLINSRAKRLSLLAGLIDTDGNHAKGCYYITTKFPGLRDDILFLVRSLGMAAYSSELRPKKYPGKVYYSISISGELSSVPCLIKRKKAAPRRQVKDVLQTGFAIEDIGEGEYFGFELDGDGRFLLGDFTVTHNTSFFETLAGKKWFCDLAIAVGDKDSKMMTSGFWLGELPDLAALKTARDQNMVKAFFSTGWDKFRPPYGKSIVSAPRRIVFGGTTNDYAYLSDATGNRRYCCVLIDRVDLAALIRDRDQLFAEAVLLYDRHVSECQDKLSCACWWFTEEETRIQEMENDKRLIEAPEREIIAAWWRGLSPQDRPERLTTSQVAEEAFSLDKEKVDTARAMRYGTALRALGFERKRERVDGNPTWCYVATEELRNAPQVKRTRQMAKLFAVAAAGGDK